MFLKLDLPDRLLQTVAAYRRTALLILVTLLSIHAVLFLLQTAHQQLLDQHAFRQTQTALTAYWMQKEGFKLAYETPVLGYPWAVPFEFPAFQWLAAQLATSTGLNLDAAGRSLSFLFFVATLYPALKTMQLLRLPSECGTVFAALYLSNPLYLYWARTFMIESAALFFTVFFIYYGLRMVILGPTLRNCAGTIVLASLALLQKVTTALVPLGFVVLAAPWLWRGGIRDLLKSPRAVLVIALSFAVPLALGFLWIQYSDAVKSQNPIGVYLTADVLRHWNLGTLEQRWSRGLWWGVVIRRGLWVNLGGIVGAAALAYAAWQWRQRQAGAIMAVAVTLYVVPLLAFTNLHIEHNYYQSANLVFALGALAIALGLLVSELRLAPLGLIAVFLVVGWNLWQFSGDYRTTAFAEFSPQRNRPLAISEFVQESVPADAPIVVYGWDWTSAIAYYSQRRSLTVPQWYNDYERTIQDPPRYLNGALPGAAVVCPERGPSPEVVARALERLGRYSAHDIMGCAVFIRQAAMSSEPKGAPSSP